MNHEEVISGISWHFLVGNESLSREQLAEHVERNVCDACADRMPEPVAVLTAAAP